MTFGMEFGDVVDHVTCPRCGAPAVVRARIKKGTNAYEDNLTCNKCHYVKFVGITTMTYMIDQRRLLRLKKASELAKTHREKQRIDAKINEVKEGMKIHELIAYPH